MEFRNKKIGEKGEEIARKYLESQGYKILEKNSKTKYFEIDIVAEKDGKLIFVEVRSKVDDNFGIPEETINRKKKWKLKKSAENYTNYRRYKGLYRIDAVCIVLGLNSGKKVKRLSHYENIVF